MKRREKEEKKRLELEEEAKLKKEREELLRKQQLEEERKRRIKEEVDAENKRLKDLAFNQGRPNSKKVEFDIRETQPQDTKPSVIMYDPKGDEDLKKGIQEQIARLKNQIIDQQSQVVNQITELKHETQQIYKDMKH